MKKWKIGVVGIRRGGAYAKVFHNNERSEITAICDLSEQNLAGAAEELGLADSACFTSFEDFLNTEIDAVVVATPIPFHEEQAVKALNAGKHVLSEVTMANTAEGCYNILKAAQNAKTRYMLAENYIYLDFIGQWKKYIDAGKIGRIHYAEAEYVHDIRDRLYDTGTRKGETYWRTYRPPIHYCTHCLGPLMYLIGKDDCIVRTTAWGNQNTIVPDLWPSTIDMQVALFETKEGRILKILRSQVTPRSPHIVTYNVLGTEGCLESGREPGYDTVGARFFASSDKASVPINCNGTKLDTSLAVKKASGHGTSDYYGAQAFLDYIEFDKAPFTTAEQAFRLTMPGIIAHEAAVEGHIWKDIPQL